MGLKIKHIIKDDILFLHECMIGGLWGVDGINNEMALNDIIELVDDDSTETFKSISDIAAFYLDSFLTADIFTDANWRTGILLTETFLNLNGYSLTFTNDELYKLSLEIHEDKYTLKELEEIIKNNIEKSNIYEEKLEEAREINRKQKDDISIFEENSIEFRRSVIFALSEVQVKKFHDTFKYFQHENEGNDIDLGYEESNNN